MSNEEKMLQSNTREQSLYAITLRTTSQGKVYGDVTVKADTIEELEKRLNNATNVLYRHMSQ